MPLMDNEFEERTLEARALSAKSKCYPRRPHAATAKSHGAATSKATKSTTIKSRNNGDDSLELVRRADHPSPEHKIMLYHGTTDDFDFYHGNSPKNGDLHVDKPGFYLTDTPGHAAMWVCRTWCLSAEDTVTVQGYQWQGTTPEKFHIFPSKSDATWNQYRAWLKQLYDWTYRDPADSSVPRPSAQPHIEALHNMEMLSG
ncbi:hypothetical protein H0H87_009636, partial [Tephrocybe sp. NHM501043]